MQPTRGVTYIGFSQSPADPVQAHHSSTSSSPSTSSSEGLFNKAPLQADILYSKNNEPMRAVRVNRNSRRAEQRAETPSEAPHRRGELPCPVDNSLLVHPHYQRLIHHTLLSDTMKVYVRSEPSAEEHTARLGDLNLTLSGENVVSLPHPSPAQHL